MLAELPSEHVRYSQWKTHDTNSVQNIIICKVGLNVHLQDYCFVVVMVTLAY